MTDDPLVPEGAEVHGGWQMTPKGASSHDRSAGSGRRWSGNCRNLERCLGCVGPAMQRRLELLVLAERGAVAMTKMFIGAASAVVAAVASAGIAAADPTQHRHRGKR
jgi:hypothetical protein